MGAWCPNPDCRARRLELLHCRVYDRVELGAWLKVSVASETLERPHASKVDRQILKRRIGSRSPQLSSRSYSLQSGDFGNRVSEWTFPTDARSPGNWRQLQRSASVAVTAWRSAGSTSLPNHGLRRSQAVVRQDGCGSAKWRGRCERKSRTCSVIPRCPSTWSSA
jgi:hypothetical protein